MIFGRLTYSVDVVVSVEREDDTEQSCADVVAVACGTLEGIGEVVRLLNAQPSSQSSESTANDEEEHN